MAYWQMGRGCINSIPLSCASTPLTTNVYLSSFRAEWYDKRHWCIRMAAQWTYLVCTYAGRANTFLQSKLVSICCIDVVALLCLVSMTDRSCTYVLMYVCWTLSPVLICWSLHAVKGILCPIWTFQWTSLIGAPWNKHTLINKILHISIHKYHFVYILTLEMGTPI